MNSCMVFYNNVDDYEEKEAEFDNRKLASMFANCVIEEGGTAIVTDGNGCMLEAGEGDLW